MVIDLCCCQWVVLIAQREWELMQALKAGDPAIVLPKGHGKHTRHENLDTA